MAIYKDSEVGSYFNIDGAINRLSPELNSKKSLKGRSSIRYFVLVSVLGVLLGCKPNETRFYELKGLRFEMDSDSTTYGQLAEYYVIENCPTEKTELIETIQEFNKRTLNSDKIEKKQPSFYSRYFYKENSNLTRFYEEEDDFVDEVIEDHLDDLIATVEYRRGGEWIVKVKLANNPDKWEECPLLAK